MSSRWMLQVQARQRAYRRRRGNESLTDREIKHGKRRVILLPNDALLIETWEHFLERIYEEARVEQINPSEWWRRLSRVVQILPGHLSVTEWKMIKRSAATGIWNKGIQKVPPEPVERLIERIRRWRVLNPPEPPKTPEQRAQERLLKGRQKPSFTVKGIKFPTFTPKR